MDLKELIAASSLNLTDAQVSQADKYLNEILKWNKTRNLVSRNLRKSDLAEHFLDCAVLQKHLMRGSVIDLGTGSGFPGICLGIIDPNRELTLVDSNRKKTSFLIHIKNELGLNAVSIKNLRVEEIEQINEIRKNNPGIKIIAHPECPPDVIQASDFAGSTSGMIKYVKDNQPKKVMMVTECSMSDNVQIDNPNVEFIRPCNLCPHMKRITLPKILDCLENETNELIMDHETIERARKSVERMAEIGR